jgi:hypothetical protein
MAPRETFNLSLPLLGLALLGSPSCAGDDEEPVSVLARYPDEPEEAVPELRLLAPTDFWLRPKFSVAVSFIREISDSEIPGSSEED